MAGLHKQSISEVWKESEMILLPVLSLIWQITGDSLANLLAIYGAMRTCVARLWHLNFEAVNS